VSEPFEISYRLHTSVNDLVDQGSPTARCDVTMACGCTGTILLPSDLRNHVEEPLGKVQVRCPVHRENIDVASWEWRELDS
jgi:hypothetical protein